MAETKIPEPRDPVEAVQHLKQIVHVVMADGIISGKEQRLLKLYADQVGLAAADVQQAIKQERRRMYQDARECAAGAEDDGWVTASDLQSLYAPRK